jgi:hypothetical protein
MNELNKADDDFVRDLEWQLRTEVRRRQRFTPLKKRPSMVRALRNAAVIILCAATGFAAAMTVEHFENAGKKKLLMVRAETALEILQARREVAAEIVNDISQQAARGLAGQAQLAEVELQSELVGFELDRARLDLEEVELTGRSPDDKPYAPVVGRRDFVAARLHIDLLAARARHRSIEAEMNRVRDLARKGLVEAVQEREMEMQVTRSEAEIEDVVRRLELRHAYLNGDLNARQVSLEERRSQARDRLETAQKVAALVTEDFEKMAAMRDDGMVSETQLKEVEFQLVAARAEARLARAELEYLEKAVRE